MLVVDLWRTKLCQTSGEARELQLQTSLPHEGDLPSMTVSQPDAAL
jgi:hypothetical protein